MAIPSKKDPLKEQEIASEVLSGNIRKCFVSLSRSDIPNYFLSLRKKSVCQTTELNQTNFTSLIPSVSSLVTINKGEQTPISVMNDNITTFTDKDSGINIDFNSTQHKVKEVGINLPIDQKDQSNSGLCQEILCDKSFNLMREKTSSMSCESEKHVSHFNLIQNFNENSFKSQSLSAIKNCNPLSYDASDRVISMNKKLTKPMSQNSASAEICHNFSAKPVELPINYLKENSSKLSRFQNNFSNHSNSSNKNIFKPFISHSSCLKENDVSLDDNSIDGVESINEMTIISSQNSSNTDLFHEGLAANSVELLTSHRNQNSFKSALSQNCSANPGKLLVNHVEQNTSKPSMSQNSFSVTNQALPLDSNGAANKVEPVKKKLVVSPFQGTSDTVYEDLPTDFVEPPLIQHQKCPVKRKRHVPADYIFSEKTSIKNQFKNLPLCKTVENEKKTTILLPGPSMSNKWKKSFIINRPSIPNKEKRNQPEILIPAYTTSGFQKKYSSTLKKPHACIRDSFKKNIKPIDSQTMCTAPVRVRGRTSNSKVFFKASCSKLKNNNIDSNCNMNKLTENGLTSHELDGKIENDVSVKPQKIRKQHEKYSVNNEKMADTSLLANARLRKGLNFISFIKGKDLKDESIELCSSAMKSIEDSNDSNKFAATKSECFTSKKRSLNSDVESVMKKQNHSQNFESAIDTSISSKNIPKLKETISSNDNSFSKTIEDDLHVENDSDQELVIDESDYDAPRTSNNSSDKHFQKISGKLLHVKSSYSDFLEKSYCFDKNLYNMNLKNTTPSDTHETTRTKLFLPTKSNNDSAEILTSNKFESPGLDEIPSKNIVSDLNISSETNSTNQNNFLMATAATSNYDKTSNPQCKRNIVLGFSKEETKNGKKTFINKRIKKSHHAKFMKGKSCTSSKPKASFQFSVHIGEILDDMNDMSVDRLVFKKYVHSLTNFFINPKNAPDTATLIYLVVHYLHLKRGNPLLKFLETSESYPYFLPSEDCVVTALLNTEKKNKSHLQGLVNSLLSTMYNLLLEKKKINVYGMSSLCRVFTELCKRNGDKQKPVSLCCDLLKQKHHNSPFLIASIIGIWKELFQITDDFSVEKVILFSSIAYGAQKRPKKITKSWESISKFLAECFAVPSVPNAKQLIEFLKEQIVMKSLQSSCENSQYLTSSLVILAAHEPWDWTKENLLNNYIVMNLKRFSSQDLNEQAFELFCDLYVDVYLLAPIKFADTVLTAFFEDEVQCKEKLYVKSCAAAALMKYVILAKRRIPATLTAFFKNNSEHSKVKLFANMVQRRMLSRCIDRLSAEDILISKQ